MKDKIKKRNKFKRMFLLIFIGIGIISIITFLVSVVLVNQRKAKLEAEITILEQEIIILEHKNKKLQGESFTPDIIPDYPIPSFRYGD